MFAGYAARRDVLQGHMQSFPSLPSHARFNDFEEIHDKYYCVFKVFGDQVKTQKEV